MAAQLQGKKDLFACHNRPSYRGALSAEHMWPTWLPLVTYAVCPTPVQGSGSCNANVAATCESHLVLQTSLLVLGLLVGLIQGPFQVAAPGLFVCKQLAHLVTLQPLSLVH